MKSNSLIFKRSATALMATALAATMAIGMVGCASNEQNASNGSAAQSSASQPENGAADSNVNVDTSSDSLPAESQEIAGLDVSPKEALKIALDKAGLKESQAQVIKSELDTELGFPYYEIEFIGPGNKEYEVEINAINREVMSFEMDSAND